jgi:transcription antitermination factor NusG
MGLAHSNPVSEGAKLRLGMTEMMAQTHTKIGEKPAEVQRTVPKGEWYVLYTFPRHEKRVAEQIETRRFTSFLPVYRSVRRWKDRRKELELALFPGYVFVRMQLENRLQVLQLPGVVRLVCFNGQPAAIAAEEIEALRSKLSGGLRIEPHPYLRTGRRVRVRSGPMQGLEGIVVRRKDRCRIVFSIDLIKRSVAVELDEADLEAA